MPDQDAIIDLLDRHDWRDTIIKLAAYAVNICNFKRINLPNGKQPEDIVMDAIDKVYNKERKWNPDNEPDLYKYLKSVINSLINNELTTASGKNEIYDLNDHVDVQTNSYVEEELYCQDLDLRIAREIKGDTELCLVYKALKDGYRPKDIADEYFLEITSVRNAQKRLHRVVLGVINTLTKAHIDG